MKRNLQIIIGLAIGGGLLWYLLRDINWSTMGEYLWSADPVWLLLAQVPIWASFFARVQRWHYIVRSTKTVRFRTLFTATQIGFLANFVLPLRAGEVVRAFILAKRADLSLVRGVAFVAMDRVADLFGLAMCMAISLIALETAPALATPSGALGGFSPAMVRSGAFFAFVGLVGLVAALVLLFVNRELAYRLNDWIVGLVSKKLARISRAHLEQFAQGLSVLRSPGDMVKAILWSMVVWGCFVASTAFFMEAFGLDYPWYTPFLIQVLVAVAVSVPGAPGFVGQFHAAFVAGILMTIPSADMELAMAVAITTHLLNFLPTVGVGVVCLLMEHSGLLALTRQSVQAQQETAEEQAD